MPADAAVEMTRSVNMVRLHADPEFAAAHKRRASARAAKRHADPIWAAAQSAKLAKNNTERALYWCPEERRDEYRALVKRFKATEARRIIEDDIALQARRAAR